MTEKRRLNLMPEVLPAPVKAGSSSVRTRTLARMQVLAAIGLAGCGGKSGANAGGSGGVDAGLPTNTTPDGGPGYTVVDPLPNPAVCNVQASIVADAAYVTGPNDAGADADAPYDGDAGIVDRTIAITLTIGQANVAVGDIALTDGAALLDHEVRGNTVRILARAGANLQFGIAMQTSCASGPATVTIEVQPGDSDVVVVIGA